jgi:drug/metabolite transporter (DMT)-like permease
MSNTDIAVFLALCAALAAAIGSVIRQRSAQEITDEPVGHFALFGMLVRDTRWWLGSVGDIASYCLLAAALARGSVMLVTALQVTVLLFALPIYAWSTRHRITGREWMWAVLLAAALAVVVSVGDPTAGHSQQTVVSCWPICDQCSHKIWPVVASRAKTSSLPVLVYMTPSLMSGVASSEYLPPSPEPLRRAIQAPLSCLTLVVSICFSVE